MWRCGAPAMVAFALLHVLPKDLALEAPQQCAAAIEALVCSADLCPPLYDQWVCKILFNTRLWAYGKYWRKCFLGSIDGSLFSRLLSPFSDVFIFLSVCHCTFPPLFCVLPSVDFSQARRKRCSWP